jgi:hypothetical protein
MSINMNITANRELFSSLKIVNFKIRDKNEQRLRFVFEIDDYGFGNWRKPSSLQEPTELLEWLTVNIRSLQNQYPQVGHAVVKRSGNGYHNIFPTCPPLTMDEFQKLLLFFPFDPGWNGWSLIYGVATLRIGAKPIVRTVGNEFSRHLGSNISLAKPQIIRIIYPDGRIMYREEIERQFGYAI